MSRKQKQSVKGSSHLPDDISNRQSDELEGSNDYLTKPKAKQRIADAKSAKNPQRDALLNLYYSLFRPVVCFKQYNKGDNGLLAQNH